MDRRGGESALRDLVAGFFAEQSAESELHAQLCVDKDRMVPVEDTSVIWPEELSQHEVVAVHLPAQDAYSDAHRPLGSIMRSRRAAYAKSSDFRHTLNGVEEREPSGIDELPA